MDKILVDLRTYRAQQGLSQKQLVAASGLSKAVVNCLELGTYQYKLSDSNLQAIADCLQITSDECLKLIDASRRLKTKKELLRSEAALANV